MNFLSRKAWKRVHMQQLREEGRKPIATKTIFKCKDEQDGSTRKKTRIVTKGFMQIPGVDYTGSFSPAATDASVRTVIGIFLYYIGREKAHTVINDKWAMEVFDVEVAFINATMGDQKVYISIPEAMVRLDFVTKEEAKEQAIQLEMSMYGNVDAALRFFKCYTHIILEMGLKQSEADPCIFYKHSDEGQLIIILATHVDDTLLGGFKKEVGKFMDDFEKHLKIERLGMLKKHLGVWWEWLEDDQGETYLKATMPKMIREIHKTFQDAKGKPAKKAATPGFPGKMLRKSEEGNEPLMITEYRSIVGKILYYTTKVRPEMANAARELSCHMSNPNDEHWKAL
jgi:hypothetical protein